MEFKNFESDLIKVINNYYNKAMYKESVKQVWLYFKKNVNEEFGIDEDGFKLVSKLFDKTKEMNPLILINKYESISDIDEQSGFSFLMKWFVSSIRNLESHEFDFEITKDEATAILNFLDIYVFGKLKKHEENLLVTDWLEFVSSVGFEDSEEYIKKVLKIMTKNQKLKLVFDILDNINLFQQPNNRKNLIKILYEEISVNQQNELVNKIDRKLIKYRGNEMLVFFNNFPSEIWKKTNEIISSKTEYNIYLAISDAKIIEEYGTEREIIAPDLAYVSDEYIRVFEKKEKIESLLIKKIREDSNQGLFVFEYFSDYIRLEILKNNEFFIGEIRKLLSEGLSNIKELITPIIPQIKEIPKMKELVEEYDNFVVKENIYEPYCLLD